MNTETKNNLKWAAKIYLSVCVVFAVLTIAIPARGNGGSTKDMLFKVYKTITFNLDAGVLMTEVNNYRESIKEHGIEDTYREWRESLQSVNEYNPNVGTDLILMLTPERIDDND